MVISIPAHETLSGVANVAEAIGVVASLSTVGVPVEVLGAIIVVPPDTEEELADIPPPGILNTVPG